MIARVALKISFNLFKVPYLVLIKDQMVGLLYGKKLEIEFV